MKKIVCKSGLQGEQCHLRDIYVDFFEWQAYSNMYRLSKRLGFNSARIAWALNPVVEGSTNPSDFRLSCDTSKFRVSI